MWGLNLQPQDQKLHTLPPEPPGTPNDGDF